MENVIAQTSLFLYNVFRYYKFNFKKSMENKVSVLDFIKKGWEVFKANPGTNIAIMIALFVISVISGFISSSLWGIAREVYNLFDSLVIQTLVGIFVISYAILNVRSSNPKSENLVSKAFSRIDFKIWLNFAIYSIIILALPAVLIALFALSARVTYPTMMAGFAMFAPILMLAILAYFIAVSIYLSWGYYVMIDENLPPIDAMKKSIRLVQDNLGLVFLVMVSVAALNILGVIPFMLGLLITAPVSLFATAALYEYLSSGKVPESGEEEKETNNENEETEKEEDKDNKQEDSAEEENDNNTEDAADEQEDTDNESESRDGAN